MRLRIDDGWTRNFRPDHPIVRDVRWFERESVGIYQLDLMLERRDGRAVDVGAIDKRLLKAMPLDVRVVLAWDADNTDVDLHVIDANGEEVYYGRALSYQGGAITRAWSMVHGFAMLLLDDRMSEVLRRLPKGTTMDQLFEAMLKSPAPRPPAS